MTVPASGSTIVNVEPLPSRLQTFHLAAVSGDDVLDDAQPQTGAAGDARTCRIDAVEPFEDSLRVLGGEPDALVGHGDLNAFVDEFDPDSDAGPVG